MNMDKNEPQKMITAKSERVTFEQNSNKCVIEVWKHCVQIKVDNKLCDFVKCGSGMGVVVKIAGTGRVWKAGLRVRVGCRNTFGRSGSGTGINSAGVGGSGNGELHLCRSLVVQVSSVHTHTHGQMYCSVSPQSI